MIIIGRLRILRYSVIIIIPEPVYESPFADEEMLVSEVVAKSVLRILKQQKEEEDTLFVKNF